MRHFCKQIYMRDDFIKVKNDLPNQSFAKDLVCFICFGSSVVNNNMGKIPDDVDVCLVLNNRATDLHIISNFIFSSFEKPDFRIYFQDEVNSNLPFVDKGVGVFAAEYFANGISLYGENIFIRKSKELSRKKLKASYLNKIFEYIVRIREAHVSKNSTEEYKMWHIHKYIIRISVDILLYEGIIKYDELKNLTKYEIVKLSKKNGIVKEETFVDFDSLDNMYELFKEINLYVVNYHTSRLAKIKNQINRFIKNMTNANSPR